MISSLRGAAVPIGLGLAGAITGWLVITAAMPHLRRIDPLGFSPVVLITILGVAALGWYLRGRAL
jgi:hypothetical protein